MFKSYQEINVEWLKANSQRIYFFGLGFIQVKINEEWRLHFYHPEIPAFVESPHNHRYDFTSTILKGSFTNTLYSVREGKSHVISLESCNENILSPKEVKHALLEKTSQTTYYPGQSYFMSHSSFHEALGSKCITLLQRSEYKKEFAEVALRVGEQKTCPFKEKLPEEKLWLLIKEMLES